MAIAPTCKKNGEDDVLRPESAIIFPTMAPC